MSKIMLGDRPCATCGAVFQTYMYHGGRNRLLVKQTCSQSCAATLRCENRTWAVRQRPQFSHLTCKECGETKAIAEFPKRDVRPSKYTSGDAYRTTCKLCMATYRHAYYLRTKDHQSKSAHASRQRFIAIVRPFIVKYAHERGCVVCRTRDAPTLTFVWNRRAASSNGELPRNRSPYNWPHEIGSWPKIRALLRTVTHVICANCLQRAKFQTMLDQPLTEWPKELGSYEDATRVAQR